MTLKHSFFSQSALYFLSTAFNKLTPFLLIPFYTRYFSVSDYGILNLYLTFGMFIVMILEGQLLSGVMRYFYELKLLSEKKDLLSSTIIYYFFGALLLLTGSFLARYLVSRFHLELRLELLAPIIITFFFVLLYDLTLLVIRLSDRLKTFFVLNVLDAIISMVLSIGLVVFFEWGLIGALWGIYLAKGIIVLFVVVCNLKTIFPLHVSIKYLKPLMQYGFPLVPSVMGSWFFHYASYFLVAFYLSPVALGIYSLIHRLGQGFLLLIQTFKLIWYPYILKCYVDTPDRSTQAIRRAYALFNRFGFGLVALISLGAPFLIRILAPEAYWPMYPYLVFALLTNFWYGQMILTATGNIIAKKTWANTVGSLVGSGVGVMCAWFLIYKLQLCSVFVMMLLGAQLCSLICLCFAQRFYFVPHHKGSIAATHIASVVMTLMIFSFIMMGKESYSVYVLAVLFAWGLQWLFGGDHGVKMRLSASHYAEQHANNGKKYNHVS